MLMLENKPWLFVRELTSGKEYSRRLNSNDVMFWVNKDNSLKCIELSERGQEKARKGREYILKKYAPEKWIFETEFNVTQEQALELFKQRQSSLRLISTEYLKSARAELDRINRSITLRLERLQQIEDIGNPKFPKTGLKYKQSEKKPTKPPRF